MDKIACDFWNLGLVPVFFIPATCQVLLLLLTLTEQQLWEKSSFLLNKDCSHRTGWCWKGPKWRVGYPSFVPGQLGLWHWTHHFIFMRLFFYISKIQMFLWLPASFNLLLLCHYMINFFHRHLIVILYFHYHIVLLNKTMW